MSNVNKTQYGLCSLGWAKRNSDKTYGDITMLPGAISLGLTRNDNNNGLAADNGEYDSGNSSKTVTGDLNVAMFNDAWLTGVLGYIEEAGGIGEGEGTSIEFALVGEVSGDQGGYRFVWYDCTATAPTTTHQTIEIDGTVQYATETCQITSKICELSNGNRRRAFKCEKGSTNYANFFNAVFVPAAATTTTGA